MRIFFTAFLFMCLYFHIASQVDPAVQNNLDSIFQGLKFRNIGPFRGGRTNCVSDIVNNTDTYYMGTVGGGIWKTKNGGIQWKNVSDGFLNVGSIGALVVSESDLNVIYAGTGEHAVRGVMSSFGDGVYKWRIATLRFFYKMSR